MGAHADQTRRLRAFADRFVEQAIRLESEANAEQSRGNSTTATYLRARAAGLRAAEQDIRTEVGY